MKFDVSIWKTMLLLSPDIQTWVEVDDPITAALLVMDRFRLRSARYISVYPESSSVLAASFSDVDLDGAPAPASNWLVSYDYSL